MIIQAGGVIALLKHNCIADFIPNRVDGQVQPMIGENIKDYISRAKVQLKHISNVKVRPRKELLEG